MNKYSHLAPKKKYSSISFVKLKQCYNKKSYASEEHAIKSYAALKYNQRCYECKICKKWHLTSG